MKNRDDKMEVSGHLWFNLAEQRFLGGERIELLERIDQLGSIAKAAKASGLSYKTAWDMVRTINNMSHLPLVDRLTGGKGGGGTSLTPEGKRILGQYRVIQEELQRLLGNLGSRLGDTEDLLRFIRRMSMKVSARNSFAGTVTGITKGAVNSEVTLTLKGGVPLVAVITNGAVENLGLAAGTEAYAIIKASSVIIGTDLHNAKVSARNVFCGTVAKVIQGPVSSEIDVEIGGGNTVSAVITHGSAERLDLKPGDHACALFKASSVIIGVS
ncbi:TOBE domain-containing protein [Geomonas sp. Red32]|uniref:TOBE domain-containing protein n=1 Tax=Geomonas sp. Red32 TaxID=2912856 RepID=UPI00202CD1B7|nr:TOBE domain-containing protein [Geomonas sp. Red32]MCM0082441.1 TOBE domain-containing protein [Geomonas sp. Red32]